MDGDFLLWVGGGIIPGLFCIYMDRNGIIHAATPSMPPVSLFACRSCSMPLLDAPAVLHTGVRYPRRSKADFIRMRFNTQMARLINGSEQAVDGGKQAVYRLSDEDTAYVSSPQDSEEMMKKVLLEMGDEEPCIALDCFAGAGGNTMHLMCRLPVGSALHAVQRVSTPAEIDRLDNLRYNVATFRGQMIKAGMHPASVEIHATDIKSFVSDVALGKFQSPSLLFVDPPWSLDGVRIASYHQLIWFMKENIFSSKDFRPRFIVFKLPPQPEQPVPVDEITKMLFGSGHMYKCIDVQHPRGKYFTCAFMDTRHQWADDQGWHASG